MIRLLPAAFAAITGLAGCAQDQGPAIAVSEVRIFAAMPGSGAGVAYMSIANNGSTPIVVSGVRSPQFDRIEMHETTVDELGVSRMKRLEQVVIPAEEAVDFQAGGKHLMLMDPRPDTTPGSPVTLEINYSGGLLLVSATLQNRLPAE